MITLTVQSFCSVDTHRDGQWESIWPSGPKAWMMFIIYDSASPFLFLTSEDNS